MSKLSITQKYQLILTIFCCVIFILLSDSTVSAQERSDLEKVIFSGDVDGKAVLISVTPTTPLVGTIFFSIDLSQPANNSPISDATVKLILGTSDEYIFESFALSNPQKPGNYIANLTVDHAGEWTAYVKIEESNGNKTQLEIPLTIEGSPLTAGLTGTILWAIIFCVIVSIGFYIWRNAKTPSDISQKS